MEVDVAIIGGGPAGSTTGILLKKYNPELEVAIFERERFPRDHVGESLLPVISQFLDEMGVWDKIEAAGFPIKIGATYRWGKTDELWDFEFLPSSQFKNEPRPARYAGQRRKTAFQVDRARYDKILLDQAATLGCAVSQETRVKQVETNGDRVERIHLDNAEQVSARHYVDCSGHSGTLRRAMGVEATYPTSLQNIAIWDYWQNADWAVEIGVGATRIQVISVRYGWLWFIPLGPTRTSVGLVIPADYYKSSGKRPEELYTQALRDEPHIARLMERATSEGKLTTTRDWSFLAARHCGENWFLAGESSGFADPILSAGLTMAHAAGREAANTIVEMDRKRADPQWLRSEYNRHQTQRICSHIRFADYWYTANEQFKDLQNFTSEIARERGLELSPEKAWAWLAAGGFVDEDFQIGIAGFSISSIKDMGEFLGNLRPDSEVANNNVFVLNLAGADLTESAGYGDGQVRRNRCYRRNGRVLPLSGVFEVLVHLLQRESKLPAILQRITQEADRRKHDPAFTQGVLPWLPQGLEAMINDGWVQASCDASLPLAPLNAEIKHVQKNRDPKAAL